jgi:DNA recombination protein RmuC
MEYVAIAVAIIAAAVAVVAALKPGRGGEGALLIQQQMDSLREQVSKSLAESAQALRESLQGLRGNMQDSFSNATKAVTEVTARMSQLEESSKRILDLGKSMSELQDILKAPKLRGGLGELFLEDLLKQILPPAHFTMQHRFSTNEAVDAVIRLGDNLVPVDAKFPLENFRKLTAAEDENEEKQHRKQLSTDIKKHVDSIADKYIKPDEGTFDFAMMYIPAENVYYETIIRDEKFGEARSIAEYALSKKVIPVSPNSFYAYLKAIVLGLRGLHIEESAQEVLATLGALRGDLKRFDGDFDKLGTHLEHAASSYSNAQKRLQKLSVKLEGAETASGLPAPQDDE